jgi:Flp pilus assembly protein TadB
MDLILIGAVATGIAVFSGLMAQLPSSASPAARVAEQIAGWYRARVASSAALLARARLDVAPRSYLALGVLAPGGLLIVGLLLSPPMGLIGLLVGALVPRLYLRSLTASEARAADDDAPRVLRAIVNRAAAGGTYPDLFGAAAEAARHRWVKADFEEILGRFYAGEAAADAVADVRRRQAGRNLALLYDALIVLMTTHQPASACVAVLGSLGEAARSNQSIARQAAAEAKGLRLQAAILAIVIPGLFLYLLAANHDLVAPVTDTALGRFVLLPAAAVLEVAGIALSLRVARLEA